MTVIFCFVYSEQTYFQFLIQYLPKSQYFEHLIKFLRNYICKICSKIRSFCWIYFHEVFFATPSSKTNVVTIVLDTLYKKRSKNGKILHKMCVQDPSGCTITKSTQKLKSTFFNFFFISADSGPLCSKLFFKMSIRFWPFEANCATSLNCTFYFRILAHYVVVTCSDGLLTRIRIFGYYPGISQKMGLRQYILTLYVQKI